MSPHPGRQLITSSGHGLPCLHASRRHRSGALKQQAARSRRESYASGKALEDSFLGKLAFRKYAVNITGLPSPTIQLPPCEERTIFLDRRFQLGHCPSELRNKDQYLTCSNLLLSAENSFPCSRGGIGCFSCLPPCQGQSEQCQREAYNSDPVNPAQVVPHTDVCGQDHAASIGPCRPLCGRLLDMRALRALARVCGAKVSWQLGRAPARPVLSTSVGLFVPKPTRDATDWHFCPG